MASSILNPLTGVWAPGVSFLPSEITVIERAAQSGLRDLPLKMQEGSRGILQAFCNKRLHDILDESGERASQAVSLFQALQESLCPSNFIYQKAAWALERHKFPFSTGLGNISWINRGVNVLLRDGVDTTRLQRDGLVSRHALTIVEDELDLSASIFLLVDEWERFLSSYRGPLSLAVSQGFHAFPEESIGTPTSTQTIEIEYKVGIPFYLSVALSIHNPEKVRLSAKPIFTKDACDTFVAGTRVMAVERAAAFLVSIYDWIESGDAAASQVPFPMTRHGFKPTKRIESR